MKSRSGQDCSRLMFLDIETIPDYSRINLFNIPPAPEVMEFSDCPEPVQFMLGPTGTKPKAKLEAELKAMLSERVLPPAEWMSECVRVECELGQNRSTVIKLLNTTLNKLTDLINASSGQLRKCSLDPHRCRVLSTGIIIGDGPTMVEYTDLTDGNASDENEAATLTHFWEQAANCTMICGFGIHHFDIPILMIRSAYLGVQPTRQINMAKYNGDLLDMSIYLDGKLKEILSNNRIGKEYEDVKHGGEVLDAWLAGKHEEIVAYQGIDVENEKDLFSHFSGYFWM